VFRGSVIRNATVPCQHIAIEICPSRFDFFSCAVAAAEAPGLVTAQFNRGGPGEAGGAAEVDAAVDGDFRATMKEVMRQRLSKACDLLVSGELPVVEIAAHVGFMTPQYFNFQFKKKFGIPPQAYRERERRKDG
jgi:hypothetical protein